MAASQELMSEIVLEENENTIYFIQCLKKKQGDKIDYFVCITEHQKNCDIGLFPTGNLILFFKEEFDVLLPLMEISKRFRVDFEGGNRVVTLCKVGNPSLYEIYLEKKEGTDGRLLIKDQALKNLFDLRYEINAGFGEDVAESAPKKNKPIDRAYFYDI